MLVVGAQSQSYAFIRGRAFVNKTQKQNGCHGPIKLNTKTFIDDTKHENKKKLHKHVIYYNQQEKVEWYIDSDVVLFLQNAVVYNTSFRTCHMSLRPMPTCRDVHR